MNALDTHKIYSPKIRFINLISKFTFEKLPTWTDNNLDIAES